MWVYLDKVLISSGVYWVWNSSMHLLSVD